MCSVSIPFNRVIVHGYISLGQWGADAAETFVIITGDSKEVVADLEVQDLEVTDLDASYEEKYLLSIADNSNSWIERKIAAQQ